MIRKLCYRHHRDEFNKLSFGQRYEAHRTWIIVNEDCCEECHPELLEEEETLTQEMNDES